MAESPKPNSSAMPGTARAGLPAAALAEKVSSRPEKTMRIPTIQGWDFIRCAYDARSLALAIS